jgi:hypothetical protein
VKRFALLLVWLALAKVAIVEGLSRQALVDAVVAGHETAARAACSTLLPRGEATVPQTARIRVAAGDRSVDVALWQIGSADWAARYRRASLVVEVGGQAGCIYDVHNRIARKPA